MGTCGLHNLNPLCTHPRLEVRNAELYDYWCPNACCATKKDIAPENPDTTTVSGFFRAPIFKCKQKDIFLC